MYRKFYIFVVIIFSLTLSCTRKYITPQDFKGKILNFGSGGGFTGRTMQYSILENGQIFEVIKDSTYLNLGYLNFNSVEQMFRTYSTFRFNELKINDPGNRYYFIIDNFDNKKNRLVWGRSTLESTNLDVFYKNAMDIITEHLNKKNNE